MSRVGDIIQVYSVKMGGLSARGKNSEKDVEARNSNIGKETDTTVFSRRDNLRKSDRSDSLIKNRSYLKQKGSGNESYIFHLDQSGQLDLDKSAYSNSNRNIQVMPDSNKTNLNLSVQQGTNLQNGFDFPLHTFQEKSIRGKSGSDHTEPGIRRRENDGNLNYSRNDDAIGDDEPLFPIIVNKRELLNNEKGNNRNNHYKDRSVSNQRNARTTANQDLEKHNSEEALEKNRVKKTLKGKQNSSIQVPKNGKMKGKRGSSVEPRTLKEKRSMDNEQLRTPKPDQTKVNLRQILQQLASYLDDNDNNQSIEAPEGREDEKQTENSKLNSKKSQNKHVPRNPSQKPKVFPNLKKDPAPKSFDILNFKNKSYFLTQKVSVKPRYLDAIKKPSQTSSLIEGINSMSHVSSIQKKPSLIESNLKKQPINGKNFIEKNRRIISNLLKPISNGQRNYLKSQASVLKDHSSRHIRSQSNNSAQSSRSKLSSGTNTPKNKVSQRSFRFKADNSHVDNNNLVRELYRVRGSSRKSLRSEGDLKSDREMKINKSFLNEGTPSKSNFNEANNENKHEDNNNLLSVPQENYQDATISIVNEESNKALENSSTFINPVANKLYSPSNSQYQGDGPDRLSSFLDNSFSQKRKSPIEKFGKEWEEQKKRVEKGVIKDAPIIQFASNNENVLKGKNIVFEKTERISPFLYKDSAPGPGKYKVASSNIKGFSFGKEKRADITELPVLQDVNKMLDPIRHVQYE